MAKGDREEKREGSDDGGRVGGGERESQTQRQRQTDTHKDTNTEVIDTF